MTSSPSSQPTSPEAAPPRLLSRRRALTRTATVGAVFAAAPVVDLTAGAAQAVATTGAGAAIPAAAKPKASGDRGGKKGGKKGGKGSKGSKGGKGKHGAAAKRRERKKDAAIRHMANRFAYGYTPELAREIDKAGSPKKWFNDQLNPAAISDGFADRLVTWWPSLSMDHATLWQREKDKTEYGWVAMQHYARWVLLRRIYSNRQVHEIMTEFWENHLHVSVDADGVPFHRTSYGRTIRTHALGKYTDLLTAAITHPAMGIYLDNAISTKRGVNENLGRELLEIHTLGVGNYTEDDVKNSARMLTGYRVDMWRTFNPFYDPTAHVTGEIRVGGFVHPNTDPDGQAATVEYLHWLARHPATARRICTKLAKRFVSDTPSIGLVDRLTKTYLSNDTAIVPVLKELIASTEFEKSAGAKVRTPSDDVIASYRALRIEVKQPRSDESAAHAILWQASGLGHRPFQWSRPDGMPDDATAWTNGSRLLASFNLHYTLAGGWWPTKQVKYRKAKHWVPRWGMPFEDLVDRLSRNLTGRPASQRLIRTCCQITGVKRTDPITREHGIVTWQMPLVIATILDTPDFMTR